ncbi:MAG TPA: DUF3231 family protein [Bacillota bacterium]|nr:DUF3231 family protein [Bacillota bacterium]
MTTQQQEPFHSGEIYHLWMYLYYTKAYIVTLQVLGSHTGDHDLKTFLNDLQESVYKEEEQQVEAILKQTGIRLPPAPPDRPNVELQDIPAGGRFNELEITIIVQKEFIYRKETCSYMMGITFQEDIQALFSDFHTTQADYETKLKHIAKQKGWLTPPPINVKSST